MTLDDCGTQVGEDAEEAVREGMGCRDGFEECYESLFLDDSVAGDASGSCAFNAREAVENVSGIVFDDGFADMCRGFGYEGVPVDKGPEALDVIAGCLVLDELHRELEELFDGLAEEDWPATSTRPAPESGSGWELFRGEGGRTWTRGRGFRQPGTAR